MILCLNTSTPTCEVVLVTDDNAFVATWEAGRTLAQGLLGFLENTLAEHGATWHDISGMVVFRGPGSFTGLRIGITVVNTLADALWLPIVGEQGAAWQEQGVARLKTGANDRLVLPEYGAEAMITTPRK